MDVIVFPIRFPKMICKDWLEELFPIAGARKVFEILEVSVQDPDTVLIGVFNQKTKELKGFLWAEGNELDETLFVNSIYVHKSCRKNPKFVGALIDHVRTHYKGWGFRGVYFMTRKPSFFLKRGYRVFEETCLVLED